MVQVQLGYAADEVGNGVAYARLSSRSGERLVRAAFRAQRFSGLDGREVAYAALSAIALMLSERGVERPRFLVPDAALVADRNEHRDVPLPIVLPYVRLGCILNRFKAFALEYGSDPDLTQRAVAEVALTPAA
jgi:hypothetical protein